MANIKQPFGPEKLPGISRNRPQVFSVLIVQYQYLLYIVLTICLLIGKEPTAYFGN